MSSPTLEYLPDATESNQHPRSMETEKRKVFTLAPAEPALKTPYELREQVCRCNDAALTTFAKLLFCRLTDMAFQGAFKRGEGVLVVSKKFLADDFAVEVSTITRATRLLETTGFLWTKTAWTGAIEITWWFIREWADDSREYDLHSGANTGRRIRGVQRNTVRNAQGKFQPNPGSLRSQFRAWLKTVKRGLLPDHGADCSLTTGSNAPCHGAGMLPVQRQPRSLSSGSHAPGQGAAMLPDKRQPRSRTGSSHAPGQTAPVPGLTTLKSSKGEGEECTLSVQRASTPRKAARGTDRTGLNREKHFLLQVGATLERWKKGSSKSELSGSGAWWRLAFRSDRDLIERVLAEVGMLVKEGRIKGTPGAAAVDLWKRWGGKSVQREVS
jgi:hypothetical protein